METGMSVWLVAHLLGRSVRKCWGRTKRGRSFTRLSGSGRPRETKSREDRGPFTISKHLDEGQRLYCRDNYMYCHWHPLTITSREQYGAQRDWKINKWNQLTSLPIPYSIWVVMINVNVYGGSECLNYAFALPGDTAHTTGVMVRAP
ncbi:UNVERIFIED_CONTAM: hypothetical protein NCL1_30101 [Trichonephila clavipes]